MGLKVLKISSYLPEKIVTNDDLSKFVDTSDEWIKSRSGISSRRFADDESVSDLAARAVEKLLEDCDIKQTDIEVMVLASFTPEYLMPSSACMVHEKLKLHENMMCFDVNAACTGFVYAMDIMNGLLSIKKSKYGIVVCCEKISNYLDFDDRSTCVLFGDGAAALLVSYDEKAEYCSDIKTKGELEPLYCKISNNLKKYSEFGSSNKLNLQIKSDAIKMNGKEVFKFAVNAMRESIESTLKKSNKSAEDIDYFICHQANERIISYVSKKMNIGLEKFYMNLQNYGNTSAASIPIALSEMVERGIVKRGDRLLCVGFGAGLSWGSVLFQW